MKMFFSYLRRQRFIIILLSIFAAIFATIFYLYSLPAEALIYSFVLCFAGGGTIFAIRLSHHISYHKKLKRLLANVHETSFSFPEPSNLIEEDYQTLLNAVTADRAEISAEGESARGDLIDYYTLWVHQIKLPISAMNLLLQSDKTDKTMLSAELLRIEEYVEMVLSYLRLDSEASDYILRRYELDNIIRFSLRRYARIFILNKISLEFEETHRTVLTDEKWLRFIIGQILSNSLKYTPSGGVIRIYGKGDFLIINDNGIGIREEDLPRVFEKGFTGYNGRENCKSTGIGLYLCRRIAEKLGHNIIIFSKTGSGTSVNILITNGRQVIE